MYVDFEIVLYEVEGWFVLLKEWPILDGEKRAFFGPFRSDADALSYVGALMASQVEYLASYGLLAYMMEPPK